MAFEFHESITLEIPNIEEQMAAAFAESEASEHALIIEVAAIHEGLTANFNKYSAAELEKSLESWVSPYAKPIILNHDVETEAVGRVMAARMDKEADGTPFTRLQIAITDPEAMKKVADKRYLTGSVGGKAEEACCSICGSNWAKASMFEAPCKHKRGTPYKGKIASLEMKDISFKEYSFVNVPADSGSTVRSIGTGASAEAKSEEGDGWVRAVHFYDLNLNKEELTEYTESATRNVLESMKKKDASPTYLRLKGAFLTALAVEAEDKESQVEDEILEGEEDILAVTEELSTDLNAAPEEAEVEEEKTEEKPEDEAEVPAEDEEAKGDEEEPTEAEGDDEEKPVVDGDKPEGQEKPEGDVDPENAEPEKVSDEEKPKESEEVTDLNEQVTDAVMMTAEEAEALESRVAEAETQVAALLEENAKLKAALKKGLAERVVDAKIDRGLIEREDREAQLVEHVKRSASSLADSLRDFASMPAVVVEKTNLEELPTTAGTSMAIGEDTKEPSTDVKESTPEDVFVDAFMGRRKL